MIIKIEKNIPIPASPYHPPGVQIRLRGKWHVLIKNMQIGDSFVVLKRSTLVPIRRAAKEMFLDVTVRHWDIDKANRIYGWRVWRTK